MRTSLAYLAAALLLGACGDSGLLGRACKDLSDAECRASSACELTGCPACDGSLTNKACVPLGEAPQLLCPGIACAPCSGLPESVCRASAQCQALTCDTCGVTTYAGCADQGTKPAPICPDAPCALPCGDLTSEAACDSRSDCHPVYVDPGTCLCALPGCCAQFERCAAGGTADCKSGALCNSLPPTCEGPYVVAYTASCYEGCVKATDCAP